MSAEAQVAILTPARRPWAPRSRGAERTTERPLVSLAAFGALAVYGVLRWATLLSPVPGWRFFGLLALALAAATLGPRIVARSRVAALLMSVLALLALFPLAGVPMSWTVDFRVAVTANGIGEGLSALPQVLVPYLGINEWVRIVILLGAGILLLDAGLLYAFAPHSLGDLRRAGIALPLVALAIVPATLVHPRLPYAQGLVLFALLVAFMWGDRLGGSELPAAMIVVGLAGVVAAVAAPALDEHHPWVNYQALAGSFSPAHVERFDWTQRYGPLNWPRTGHEVLDVQAKVPNYWKAENLEVFNGTGWTQGQATQVGLPIPPASTAAAVRWTQTLKVTVRAMSTIDVIAAGDAAQPNHVSEGVTPGVSPGTWTAGAPLGPGETYSVAVYAPHPNPARLASAGSRYPDQSLQGERTILLPQTVSTAAPREVVFPPFHSGLPVQSVVGLYGSDGTTVMRASPYAAAFALARRLAASSSTPYAFVRSVERYLAHGYTYDENPPARRYPLESFLFTDKRGYCQQFSGAMTLLLRMGGLPARVAAGFATGTYDPATHEYVVSDIDAHSWVEVWFPGFGWVSFDPTPAAAPARGGTGLLPSLAASKAANPVKPLPRDSKAVTPSAARSSRAARGGSSVLIYVVALCLLLAAALLWIRTARRRREPSGEQLLRELERALARCGRPASGGLTLASLEHRFRASPEAASYIRAIRLARFAGAGAPPTVRQRRALRTQLRAGLGFTGRLRALWALPPRPGFSRLRTHLH